MTGSEAKKKLEKQYKNQNEWIKNNYDRQTITIPKGTKEKIKEAGFTVNGFINKLIIDYFENTKK